MVLESLITPQRAEREPWEMFFYGLLYSSIAIFLSFWVFRSHASLVMVFLTVLASVHLIYKTIWYEEEKDSLRSSSVFLLKEHGRAVSFFVFLFLGFMVSFSVWYILLPDSAVSALFSIQTETISSINQQFLSGNVFENSMIFKIVSNNLKVLFFCFLFAFFYGAGAIFILTWNASVIGTAIGNLARNKLSAIAGSIGFVSLSHYFHTYTLAILRYSVHGIPEVLAYFVGGLAGSIISVAVVNHDLGKDRFRTVLTDSINLIVISVALVFIAAVIEVFITPSLF